MNAKEMHYDFKKKLNKIDSQQYRNLLVPEIDWTLNEAQELFVKMIAEPRVRTALGFEKSQRSIDDIRTLVVRPDSDPNACINIVDNVAELPDNYWFYVSANVNMSKNGCDQVSRHFHIRQHDDEFEVSDFDKSNFEWRTVNGVFFEGGIRLFDDGTFTNESLCMTYIKRPRYIHNAADFRGGTYNRLDGTNLTGTQSCELPEGTHREIVDIAVLLATGEIESPNYQIKQAKLTMNKLG